MICGPPVAAECPQSARHFFTPESSSQCRRSTCAAERYIFANRSWIVSVGMNMVAAVRHTLPFTSSGKSEP